MSENLKLKLIKKLQEKSPKFNKLLREKLQNKLSKSGKKGSGLRDQYALNTEDNVQFEIIKSKEVVN